MKDKHGILGALVVSLLAFFGLFLLIYLPLALIKVRSSEFVLVAALHNLGFGSIGALFHDLIPQVRIVSGQAKYLKWAAWISAILASSGSIALFIYGIKSKAFATTGDRKKQQSGLIVLGGISALKKILQGKAKKEHLGAALIYKKRKCWFDTRVHFPLSTETRHCAFIGGSGAGKTNAIMPLLRSASGSGSCIIHDPKGDFSANIPGLIIAPWLAAGCAWDIAHDIKTIPQAAQFAANMIPRNAGSNSVFSDSARNVLTGIIVHLIKERTNSWTLLDIKKIMEVDADGANLEKILEKSYPQALKSLAVEKTRASVLMNLVASMQYIFMLGEAWKHTPNTRIVSLNWWLQEADEGRAEPIILQNNQAHSALAGALFSAMLDYLAGQILGEYEDVSPYDERKIWFFLDEIKALGPLKSVESLLNQGRSKGVRIVLGMQNPAQIADWSKSAESDVFGNVHSIFIGNCGDSKTQKWASEMFGKGYFEELLISYDRNNQGKKIKKVDPKREELDIIRPELFGQLKPGEFYARIKSSPFIPFFRFPEMKDINNPRNWKPNTLFKIVDPAEMMKRAAVANVQPQKQVEPPLVQHGPNSTTEAQEEQLSLDDINFT